MLTLPPKVTDRAFARLAEIGAAAQGKAVHYDDQTLEGSGETVVIDSVSLPFLASAVIDFSDELIGARFVIENPNATSSCGCGTSFAM
jgi:iron-sulfur cluster insertion protein